MKQEVQECLEEIHAVVILTREEATTDSGYCCCCCFLHAQDFAESLRQAAHLHHVRQADPFAQAIVPNRLQRSSED